MTERKFSSCSTYGRYCDMYNTCLAEGQLNSDIEATKNRPSEYRRKFEKENKRYLRKCEEGKCPNMEILRILEEKLIR